MESILSQVEAFLRREAMCLDDRKWEQWLELFDPDAVVWMPAWKNEEELTSDPAKELSLLYIRGRTGLEDRIFRIQSGDSYASFPFDRTVHITSNVVITNEMPDRITARANWLVHSFGKRGQRTLAGTTEYELLRAGTSFRISKKKMKLIDGKIDGPIDLHHIG